MKILVTGKNGQLGRSIKKLISNYDRYEFTFVGREELDLSSSESISKYFDTNNQFDAIINCAAFTAVDRAEEKAYLADEINHLAVKQLAEFANSHNAKLIHISTDYVFDGENESLYLESDNPNPINVYGKTKLLGERAILEIMINNALIIRTSWVYSEFGNNFVETILKLGSERDKISVVSDQIGSPTYATDLARAILNIVSTVSSMKQNLPSEIYHFSNMGETSWYGFAKEIFKLSKIDSKIEPILSRNYKGIAPRPKNTSMNKDKIVNAFNLTLPNWKSSLKECLLKKIDVC